MNKGIQKFAITALAAFGLATSARGAGLPYVLPDPAVSGVETGTFSVDSRQRVIVQGTPVSLTTSLPYQTYPDTGTILFKGGKLTFSDGSTSIDARMSRVELNRIEDVNGKVSYIIKGLVSGVMTRGAATAPVMGDFAVTSKIAVDKGVPLDGMQVQSSHLVVNDQSTISPEAGQ